MSSTDERTEIEMIIASHNLSSATPRCPVKRAHGVYSCPRIHDAITALERRATDAEAALRLVWGYYEPEEGDTKEGGYGWCIENEEEGDVRVPLPYDVVRTLRDAAAGTPLPQAETGEKSHEA